VRRKKIKWGLYNKKDYAKINMGVFMDKKIMSLIILIFCCLKVINAFDLWNGINTDMPKNQILEKAMEILQAYSVEESKEEWSFNNRRIVPLTENLEILDFNKYDYKKYLPYFK
jgi:hypothetical protein